ncbi:hypothetical protein REPUB_Repub09cG0047400 [Reevesia pubescens]
MAFYAISWSIWLHRNEILFRRKLLDFRHVIEIIKICILAWLNANWSNFQGSFENVIGFSTKIASSLTSQKQATAAWIALSSSWLKFNVDGSSYGNLRPAGIKGLLRYDTSFVKLKFSKSIGSAHSVIAELLAIKEALNIYATSSWVASH